MSLLSQVGPVGLGWVESLVSFFRAVSPFAPRELDNSLWATYTANPALLWFTANSFPIPVSFPQVFQPRPSSALTISVPASILGAVLSLTLSPHDHLLFSNIIITALGLPLCI